MDAKELRGLPESELKEKLQGFREEIFNLRFKATTEPIDDPGRVREMRKDIARAMTVLRERELTGKPKAKKTTRADRKQANAKKAAEAAAQAKAKAAKKAAKKTAKKS